MDNQKIDAERLAFWEERHPGRGEALMDVLRPFYDWRPELKSALPDLVERAKNAIFWREIAGVRVFRRKDEDAFRTLLWNALWVALWNATVDSLGKSLWISLKLSLWYSLWYALGDATGASASLKLSLWYLLCCSLGYILADKPEAAAKFKPLLDLWLAGNFPAGFDEEGNLLVLVAD